MSRLERAQKAFLNELFNNDETQKQIKENQILFDENTLTEEWKRQEQIKAATKAHEAEVAAKKKHEEELARNPILWHEELNAAIKKESAGMKEVVSQLDKQIKVNIRNEQALYKLPKDNKNSEHFEELYEIDQTKLFEARAERTKAELIEDYVTVEKLNNDIKSIEERLSFYDEQMKSIAAEEK